MDLIILDRDGVINHDSDAYIKSSDEWQPIAGSIEAIARLSRADFNVAVATNQAGLARGLFTQAALDRMHEKMCGLVGEAGGTIDFITYCPHHPKENCACRKPRTGMLENIQAHFGQPIADAWFVGDSLKDLQAALRFGCRPALVLTGKGKATAEEVANGKVYAAEDIPIFRNLESFVDSIFEGPVN